MGPEILKRFYSFNIESILTGSITAWYGNWYGTRRCQRKALKIDKTPATPVIDCSLYYRLASRTGVPSLGQKGFSTVFTPKP